MILVYDAETDEDEPKIQNKNDLTNFFYGKYFYVFDSDFDADTIHDIRRIIYAYDGILEKKMTSNVQYIITDRIWNQEFEQV